MDKVEKMSRREKRRELFFRIVDAAYKGNDCEYKGRIYRLSPTLVQPYDFVRDMLRVGTEYERLMRDLDPSFKAAASSEIYRSVSGWIARGLRDGKIRRVVVGNKTYLIPRISEPAIGIDTSGIPDPRKGIISIVFAFCFLPDPLAGFIYLEKHLKIPKVGPHKEFKWRYLRSDYRDKISDNVDIFLNICCDAVLAVETNALLSPIEKPDNVFKKLVQGCFSGYERWEEQKRLRLTLKEELARLMDGVPIHCDADFHPLTPGKIANFLVRSVDPSITPLHALRKSHESIPIQLADIIAGLIRTKIQGSERPPSPLSNLVFDIRKLKRRKKVKGVEKRVKAYYWTARRLVE